MSRKNRSKSVQLDDDFYGQPAATVEPLNLSELKLKCGGVTSHIDQLVYKGAPNYAPQGGKLKGVDYIPVVGRERFVRDVYLLLKTDFNRTKKRHFDILKIYIRWLDNTQRDPIEGDCFHPDLYNAYMDYNLNKCNRGEQKLGTLAAAKQMLSFFLKSHNRSLEAKGLKSVKGVKKDTESHKGIDVSGEFKPLVRCFIAAFGQFRKHFIEGTRPEIHPFWDEARFNELAEEKGWSAREKGNQKRAFKYAVRNDNTTRNHFSRLASILAFCFTGQNTTPLLNLRFSDVRFTEESYGKVYFDMTKARAKHLGFDTSMGFHKKTQEFFQQWLEVSKALQKQSGTDWVFPYFMESGEIKGCVEAARTTPQKNINTLTKKLGLAHITPSILRQTKIDTLMRVTEDIYLVSMSANNDVKTIKASYAHGNESDHKRGLAASNEALYDVVKNGTAPHEAASQAKYSYADVLSNYDYQRLRKEERENDAQTPLGVRCKDATKGAANTVKKNLEKMGIKQPEEKKCTDFLGCFECEFHRLVSETEDIWLMMSFNDTLQQMKDYPAINSLPTDKFHKLCNTIESILTRFKAVSPNNYAKAQEMHGESPHPLYSDGYSLMDLLEAFQ
ncbi:TPA: hypothetical protein NG658_003655 [Vibrio parahaemolyticus]|uniref:hypothetical protein n=1 Tax=Vibrio parahaemolyticus TaxID=670 RepID=UPI00044E25AF|nr:hypothetical protein [Vibrio parahaemolyticus]EJG1673727.1 hypothetical protein [Vibrio parahaemolyticus]ELJ8770227.1 hypothetical protein [Vibrio parahaemolyticus]ELJ8775118.1 hypothetical protein [Vibrio parahaemolyticus]ELJ8807120.1 hypothetical protein [Vibrio parahaemolyticus]ELJ8825952.1 hypothetical protein [Vibrio parahaemolyticus]